MGTEACALKYVFMLSTLYKVQKLKAGRLTNTKPLRHKGIYTLKHISNTHTLSTIVYALQKRAGTKALLIQKHSYS